MTDESDWRSATSRAYYSLYLECRDAFRRWGFAIPPRVSHRDAYHYLALPKNADLNKVGALFQSLGSHRNKADYEMSSLPIFANPSDAVADVKDAKDGFALLDAIESDPARLAAAVTAIRAIFP